MTISYFSATLTIAAVITVVLIPTSGVWFACLTAATITILISNRKAQP